MIMREFIEKYKEDIICEPSGISYSKLQNDKIKKVCIIEPMYYEVDRL